MNDVVRWVLTRDRPRPKIRGDVAAVLDKELVGGDGQRRRWAGDAFHALEGVWDNDPRTRSNIYVTAQRMLGVWQDPGMAAVAGDCDIDLEWLVKGNNTLYVCAPLHEQARLAVVFGGLFRPDRAAGLRVARHPPRPLPDLLVVLDEAANTRRGGCRTWPRRVRASGSFW